MSLNNWSSHFACCISQNLQSLKRLLRSHHHACIHESPLLNTLISVFKSNTANATVKTLWSGVPTRSLESRERDHAALPAAPTSPIPVYVLARIWECAPDEYISRSSGHVKNIRYRHDNTYGKRRPPSTTQIFNNQIAVLFAFRIAPWCPWSETYSVTIDCWELNICISCASSLTTPKADSFQPVLW